MAKPNPARVLGQRIKALRKQKRLTQEAFAETIGRSVDTVSNIERGVLATRFSTLVGIAEALGVSLHDLFDLPGSEPRTKAEKERAERLGQVRDLAERVELKQLDQVIALLQSMVGPTKATKGGR